MKNIETTVLTSLSRVAQRRLRKMDVVCDAQLADLHPDVIQRLGSKDHKAVQVYLSSLGNGSAPAASIELLQFGLLEAPFELDVAADRSLTVSSYKNQTQWEAVGSKPGRITQSMAKSSVFPTSQSKPTCTAHAFSAHAAAFHGFARNHVPSRQWIYNESGRHGGYRPNQGRTLEHVAQTLQNRGYLLERELPSGSSGDNFDEHTTYTEAQKARARQRTPFGVVWYQGKARLNAGLDLSLGLGSGRDTTSVVAVKIYSHWSRCFRSGLIHRHQKGDHLVGYHAMVLLDFIDINGVPFAVVLNSWDKTFGAASPVCPGVALIGRDYLETILSGRTAVVCQTKEMFNTLVEHHRQAPVPTRVLIQPAARIARGWWKGTENEIRAELARR